MKPKFTLHELHCIFVGLREPLSPMFDNPIKSGICAVGIIKQIATREQIRELIAHCHSIREEGRHNEQPLCALDEEKTIALTDAIYNIFGISALPILFAMTHCLASEHEHIVAPKNTMPDGVGHHTQVEKETSSHA